jgi:hypothetical protein
MFTQKFLISVILVGICCAIPASAALVTYCGVTGCSDSSSFFASATTGDTFQNIDVTANSLGTSYTDATTGAEFEDPMGLNGIASPTGWPAGTAITTGAGVSTMTITLPSSVSAIDFYVGMMSYSNFTISATDSTGGTFSSGYFAQTSLTTPLFFGITTNSTFASFTITSQGPGDEITLDDISVGSQEAPTPEAATLLLVATGLFMMSYFRRRRAPAQAASRGTVRTMSTGITPA